MKTFFVTGTDTDVGKTVVTVALLKCFEQKGWRTLGSKPISAGCELTKDGLRNSDALLIQRASTQQVSYDEINPIAFAAPVAPHLAAAKAGELISPRAVQKAIKHLQQYPVDLLLIEGAGGWRLPLGQNRYLSQVIADANMPVILVVSMKLGCLNHALLTAESIENAGVDLVGWVANCVNNDMLYFDENISALKDEISAPFLGLIPTLDAIDDAKNYIDISPLIED